MQKRFRLSYDGQAVEKTDLELLGEVSGLADDRVYAELFRLARFDGSTVSRGVLGPATLPLIAPNGATGRILVNCFRAFVGSRTDVGTDAQQNLTDIRSGISVAEGSTSISSTVALAANASGNSRWDLVYATVHVDTAGGSDTRKVKDLATGVVSAQAVTKYLQTTVSLAVVSGTPAASPAFPTTPFDSGLNYIVPLAYVRVPTGFTSGSTVAAKDIDTVAPILSISRAAGGVSARPATGNTTGVGVTGSGTSTQNGVLKWTGTAGTRPGAYMPPTMTGVESLYVALDLSNASSANWSHQFGDVVDSSRDWRKRVFRWTALVGSGATTAGAFPFGNATHDLFSMSPVGLGAAANTSRPALAIGAGSSFPSGGFDLAFATLTAQGAGATATPASNANVATNAMAAGTFITLSVDHSTGNIVVGGSGVPLCSVFFWIEASAPFDNA